MILKITKKQEVIDDVPQEISYNIFLDREYKTTWRTPENVVSANLFSDELVALRDELNKIDFSKK